MATAIPVAKAQPSPKAIQPPRTGDLFVSTTIEKRWEEEEEEEEEEKGSGMIIKEKNGFLSFFVG